MPTEIITEHTFHLHTDSEVTAEALAQSLLGLDGVIRLSTDVLSLFFADSPRIRTDVLIRSVEVASYKENFAVRLLFGKGRTMEKNIEALRKALGLTNFSSKKLICIVTGALILYVAYKALKVGDPAAKQIEDKLKEHSQQLNITNEQLVALVEAAVPDKQVLKRHVVKFVHPGGDTRSGALEMDGDGSLTIPAEAVQVIPSKFVPDEQDEPTDEFNDVQIVIRAVDLDQPERGWAAIVPQISDRRLPLRIGASIDPLKTPIGRYVQADITVIYRVNRQGYKSPIRYLLRNLRISAEE